MLRRGPLLPVLLALVLGTPAVASAAHPIALGVSVRDPGQSGALARAKRLLGRRPAIVMWYQTFAEPIAYPSQLRAIGRLGTTPMITWDPIGPDGPIPLGDIAAGRSDAYLRQAAATIRGYHRPVFVRFAHEMNLLTTIYRGSHPGDTAAGFAAAWRHVVELFRAEGAGNARWVWSPNIDCGGRCPFTAFFPGDRWVDWVGLDGYNVGTSASWSHWTSLRDLFGDSYRELAGLTAKPMMIAETGSAEMGGSKARWIRTGLLQTVPQDLPRIRAVVWFDKRKEQPWQIDSSPSSLAAFRTVSRSPLYRGAPSDSGARPPVADQQPALGGTTDHRLVLWLLLAAVVLVALGAVARRAPRH